MIQGILDGWQSGNNPLRMLKLKQQTDGVRSRLTDCWVSDFAILDGHIEVDADNNSFALEVNISDG